MKERFHVCVVAGSPPARRTLADAQRAETIAERVAGILAASIAMENQSSTGVPTTHGRIEDPAPADGAPLRVQRAMDAGTAVGPPVLLEEPLNPPLELPVLRRVVTHWAPPPGVVTGARNAVQRAQARHGVLAPLRVDERERVSFRVAQNRMAFFRRACSSCKSACARSSAWSRRISRGGGPFTATRFPRSIPSRTAFRHRDSMKG